MMEYQSIIGENSCEKVIERSRFLTYAAHVEGEDAARAFLAKVRAEHMQATHVCYGYIADKLMNEQRFSDDGEPQGTAGMPILNVLKAKGLCESAVAVVRYFGGIKLGAGGLVRAYAGCAAECCDGARVGNFAKGEELLLEVDYSAVNAALRFLEGAHVIGRDFSLGAAFRVVVREDECDNFLARATDFFHGRVRIKRLGRYFFAF